MGARQAPGQVRVGRAGRGAGLGMAPGQGQDGTLDGATGLLAGKGMATIGAGATSGASSKQKYIGIVEEPPKSNSSYRLKYIYIYFFGGGMG